MAGMFFLSFGGNMGMTMALTLIRDRTLALLEKTFSLSMISFAVLPGLAITLSGFLLGFSQWPSVFLALAAYHLILLFKIAQAAPPTANLSLPSKLISLRPLGHKRFWILLGIGSCMTGMTYTFSALAPKIVLHELGVSTFAFGLWSNVPSVGMLIGNCTALRFQEKHFMKVLTFDIFIHVLVIILLFLCVQTKNFNVGIFFGGIALMGIGGGMAYPLMTAQLLRHSEDHASTAALFTMLHFLMASQIVNLANHLPWQNILNLLTTDSLCMVGFAMLALCYNVFILRAPPLPPQHPPENA
jgi:DHA1 family bicyclomycin/chloramphenicol resistance-like MFS transporter